MVRGGEAITTAEQDGGSPPARLALFETTSISVEEQTRILESPLLQGIQIIGIREGGLVDCWVPVERIDNEEVPVHESWAQSLASQMDREAESSGGTGQYTPITLGLIEGEETLKIMDGFHRSAALKLKGEELVYSTVKLTDWDGLFDMRIFTAKDHAHVRFSRVVQWIREVWEFSGLADKLSVEQALLLYRFESSGTKLGLAAEEVEQSKAWVARKEKQWDMPAMTFHAYLKIAEHVDPQLVHATRDKTDSNALKAPTQAILKAFSEKLPDKFDLQNLVMQAAMAHNLKAPEVKALCTTIKDCADLGEATKIIANINWDTWEPEYGDTTRRALRRAHDPRFKGGVALERAAIEIERVAERSVMILDREEDVDSEMKLRVAEAQNRVEELQAALGELQLTLARVQAVEYEPATRRKRGTKKLQEELPVGDDKDESDVGLPSVGESLEDTAVVHLSPNLDERTPREKTYDLTPPSLATVRRGRPASSRPKPASPARDADVKPAAHAPVVPTEGVRREGVPETEATRVYKSSIQKILNSGRGDFPVIKGRSDIRHAEEILATGNFRGPKAVQEELRGLIDDARQELEDRYR